MKPALLLYPHISAYPVLLLLGCFCGWLLARRRSRLYGFDGKHLDNIALLIPLTGLFGARFFARLFYEKVSVLEAIQVWNGDGLVFYGGFLFGALAVLGYGIARRMNLIALGDCVAPSIPLGLALGRVGCFLAGCCWGDLCTNTPIHDGALAARIQTMPAVSSGTFPLAVSFPQKAAATKQHVKLGLLASGAERSLPVHPVQLYEAVLAGGLCLLLHLASRTQTAAGLPSIAMLLGYAFIRFCTEFLRADNKPYAGDFTFSQVVSIWIGAVCILMLAARWLLKRGAVPTAVIPYKPRPASG
jgi:phosphatidylglycerol---prolipoprotein diacylglyceryl transferase